MAKEKETKNKKIRIKIVLDVLYILVIVFLVFVAGSIALSKTNIWKGHNAYVVLSGSMEPAIKTGSIVLIEEKKNYNVGDIITFRDKDKGLNTTHRVTEILEDDGRILYKTKGDANDVEDFGDVSDSRVLGEVIFHLPYFGYVVNFSKSQTGFLLLVVLPATIIIYSEIMKIKDEAKLYFKNKKEKKNEEV